MTSTFITPTITEASRLGVSLFEETDPVELWPNHSKEEVEIVIRAVYRQVFGNAYVMESERLSIPESKLKQGQITVRDFVRQVAKSEFYRNRFFSNCSRYRSIELNFKHLLGRAPESYEEMTTHSHILDEGGFEAEIDSYIDSEEYQTVFGENVVPFYRGYKTKTGQNMVGFTHFFQLVRGASSSDKENITGNSSRLNRSILKNSPSPVISPSSSSTYGGLTDVNKLLATVLKPNIPVKSPGQVYQDYIAQTEAYQSLKRQCEEQAKTLESLQKQLAELQPFGAIGAAQLNKWQSSSSGSSAGVTSGYSTPTALSRTTPQSGSSEQYESLVQQSQEQQKAIAALEQQIAQLRPLAAIGAARLNKWRSRTFS